AATLLTQNLFKHGYALGKLWGDLSALCLYNPPNLVRNALALERQKVGNMASSAGKSISQFRGSVIFHASNDDGIGESHLSCQLQ
ncbi:hypothetical protein QCD27_16670, partial [Providencia stuartii]|nr:hypothetical protein [Providencia stuartii]